MEDTVGHPKEISVIAVKTKEPLEQVAPILCLPPIIFQADLSRSVPSTSSEVEHLEFAMEFLRYFLSPTKKQFLGEQGAQQRMMGALRSLAQVKKSLGLSS